MTVFVTVTVRLCVCVCVCVFMCVYVLQLTEYSKLRAHHILQAHLSLHLTTCVFPRYYRAHVHKEICKENASDGSRDPMVAMGWLQLVGSIKLWVS